ncbi:hypothetical protein SEA_TOKKI_85 [Arthrobacter phage Tokki]|nr:hypothetical protein SEA_TOKKI_85 [Arthrobacter phage Tokki]
MNEYFTTRDNEWAMTEEMCKRVNLHHRAGTFILSMLRIKSRRMGNQVDMVLVAKLIKYISSHQDDFKPQFRGMAGRTMSDKPGKYTFLK